MRHGLVMEECFSRYTRTVLGQHETPVAFTCTGLLLKHSISLYRMRGNEVGPPMTEDESSSMLCVHKPDCCQGVKPNVLVGTGAQRC